MIPNPYLLLGGLVAFIAVAIGGFSAGHHYATLGYERAIAQQQTQAATVLAKVTAAASAKDAANSAIARNIDESHAHELEAINASRDDFARRLRIAQRGQCGAGAVPAAPGDPGHTADAAGSGDNGPGGAAIASGQRLRDAALELQAYAKECNAWATKIGR